MIESIQFSEGVLRLTVSGTRGVSAHERRRSIKFDLGKGGTIAEFHSREFMDLVKPIYPEGAEQVCNLILELLRTHTRVGRIYLDCLYRASESLEGGTAADEQVKLARGTV